MYISASWEDDGDVILQNDNTPQIKTHKRSTIRIPAAPQGYFSKNTQSSHNLIPAPRAEAIILAEILALQDFIAQKKSQA